MTKFLDNKKQPILPIVENESTGCLCRTFQKENPIHIITQVGRIFTVIRSFDSQKQLQERKRKIEWDSLQQQ